MSETATTETAVAKRGAAGVKELLAQSAFSGRFNEILSKRAPQFMASIVAVAHTLPKDCDPMSIISAATIAATLDLPINKDLGFAWIVPYKNKGVMMAQFQLGYKGLIQLAQRSGSYKTMNMTPVYKGELTSFNKLTGDFDLSGERESEEVIGYAVYFKLTNGFEKSVYWTKEQVLKHAGRFSQSYRGGFDSPWKSDFDAMAMKTVLKNTLSHWGILSVELRQGIKFDQGVVIDVASETVEYPDNAPTAVIESPKREGPPRSPLKKAEAIPASHYRTVVELIADDGRISTDQVLAYCRENKLAKDDCVDLIAVSDLAMLELVGRWPTIKDEIASIQI